MKYKIATKFSNGTEYEVFLDNYCYNNCIYYKEDGSTMEDGNCPIEYGLDVGRWDDKDYPSNVLLEVWTDGGEVMSWHMCPFYTKLNDH